LPLQFDPEEGHGVASEMSVSSQYNTNHNPGNDFCQPCIPDVI